MSTCFRKMKPALLLIVSWFLAGHRSPGQNFTEILGRPADSSITMSILFDQAADVYWEYGTSLGIYSLFTPYFIAKKDTALEAVFIHLVPDTRYYYRTRYRPFGTSGSYLAGAEHTFNTQRRVGSTYTFAIEADPHMDTNSAPDAYSLTLQNMLAKNPDFLVDLGDNFMSEKLPVKEQADITSRHLLYRQYYGLVCHSSPLFLVIGNHEGELGWLNDGAPDCLPVMAANTRKMYYPNPYPDGFYSGNNRVENYTGLNENYYAWEWGDALFVVIDPYWYTTKKPGWGWTLGIDQYNWFRDVLATSKSKYKFVFCHHLLGGNGDQARGGTEYADFYEMGGYNADSTWGFNQNRPGWDKPVHALMKDYHVNIFFHGHDHFYGKQEKDGIIYLEVPQPSCKNINANLAAKYGYFNGTFINGRGYVLVTVSGSEVKVDYFKTYLPAEEDANHKNAELAHTFKVNSNTAVKDNNRIPFFMGQNFPNPFNWQTTIGYEIEKQGQVELSVFDVYGREITTLVKQFQPPGHYNVNFDPAEFSATSGIYYCEISVDSYSKTMKMIYLK